MISSNFQANRGKLPWPTERGTITSKFGSYTNPITKTQDINIGIYITTIANAEVRAVFEGEVTKVVAIPGANRFVIVKHGNYFTVYLNLADVSVNTGDKILLKQTIGKVFTEKGAHTSILQFQVYEGQNKLDPELWLSKM